MKQWTLRQQLLYLSLLTVIIVISYRFFSSANYPLLNSDDGVGVLMTHYLDFPHDIYFWGQDRLGSLIPLISQLWTKGFGCSPLVAYSLTNYLLLTLGFFGFANFFREYSTKLLFALLWFLPFHQFIDLVHYPIGLGYSILGSSLLLMRWLKFEAGTYFSVRNHLLLLLLVVWLGAGIWMSDLIAVNLACLLFALLIHRWRMQRKWFPRPEILFWSVVGIVGWGWFIITSKLNAPAKTPDFQSFNTLTDVGRAFSLVWESTLGVMTGENTDRLTPFFPWLSLIVLLLLLFFRLKGKLHFTPEQQKWRLFLRLDFVAVLLVLFSLHWILINEMGRRYFVASYITLGIATLMTVEGLQLRKQTKRLFTAFLFFVALVGSLSHFSYLLTIHPKTWRSAAAESRKLERFGKVGIIANYWFAYRHSCVNPEMIHATPHDLSDVKNRSLVAGVFAQPRLLVIREWWMDRFPDTLVQFRIPLKRIGKPFRIAGAPACEYKRLPLTKTYTIAELAVADTTWKHTENGFTRLQLPAGTAMTDRIVQSGPFATLVPGTYSVTYRLQADSLPDRDTLIGEVLIAAEYGAIQIKQSPVYSQQLREGKPVDLTIWFVVKEFTFNVEFLFRTKGLTGITIETIRLQER